MMLANCIASDEPSEGGITTSELLSLAAENAIEASLLLTGGLRSTHFLYQENGLVIDEGCDGDLRKVSPALFLLDYPDGLEVVWRIDQIILK